MMKVLVIMLLGLQLLVNSAALAKEVRPFILTNTPAMMAHEGTTTEMQSWEDGMRQSSKPGNYEWWYFDANLDDGSKIVATFFTKPTAVSIGPRIPGVTLVLTKPDGTTISDSKVFFPTQFSASKSKCDVKIGKQNRVYGDLETYVVRVATKHLKIDLTFHRVAPSWRLGAGKVYFDKKLRKYMGWVIPIPSGTVEGTITSSEGTKNVTGSGYHDHNWGNYPIYMVYDYWFWGRAHVDGYTVVFFDGVGVEKWGGKHLPIFMMAKDDKILLADPSQYAVTTGVLVKDSAQFGRKSPEKLFINAESEDIKVDLVFSNPKIIDRTDVIGDLKLNWLTSWLRPYFNPWYLRFDSDIDGQIMMKGSADTFHGKALYEMMILGNAKTLGK